jgi:hypothetical protein
LDGSIHLASTDGWRLGAVVGAEISCKRFSLVYQHFFAKSSGENVAPPIRHSVDLMMLRYRVNEGK